MIGPTRTVGYGVAVPCSSNRDFVPVADAFDHRAVKLPAENDPGVSCLTAGDDLSWTVSLTPAVARGAFAAARRNPARLCRTRAVDSGFDEWLRGKVLASLPGRSPAHSESMKANCLIDRTAGRGLPAAASAADVPFPARTSHKAGDGRCPSPRFGCRNRA